MSSIYKFSITLIIFALLASLLSACTERSDTQKPTASSQPDTSTYEAASSDSESVPATDEQIPDRANISDNINWSNVHDPLINTDIKTKLQAAVHAIADKNVQQFHTAMGDHAGTTYDYLLNNTMDFTEVDTAYREGKRILVPVSGQLKVAGDTAAKKAAYTFYFEKTTAGDWRIVTID